MSPLRRRLAQLAWIVDFLDDIESDFSVFHRVDDVWSLPGPRFFRLAWRLAAYQGVMQARAVAEAEEREPAGRSFEYGQHSAAGGGRSWNPGTVASIQSDPALQGIFSFG